MGRKHQHVKAGRPQSSKRVRQYSQDLDLMVRFTASRDRDRDGMGR